MTVPLLRKIFLHCLRLAVCCALSAPLAAAADQVSLLKAAKTDSEAESRIVIDFSAPPAFRLQQSADNRIELLLRNVKVGPAFKELAADATLSKMESRRGKDELTLDFQLNRSLRPLDSFFTMRNSRTGKAGRVQLVLVLPWEAAAPPAIPRNAATPAEVPKSQPAAPASPEAAGPKTVPAGRAGAQPDSRLLSSAYSGNWWKFFADYEVAVRIPPLLRYSLPPFPALSLLAPESAGPEGKDAARARYRQAIEQGQAGDWRSAAADLEAGIKALGKTPTPPGFMLLYSETLLHSGAFDRGHEILATLAASRNAGPERIMARYLAPLAQAAAGRPYDAAYEINELQRELTETTPLTPYLQLLKAEIALGLGHGQEALGLLAEGGPAAAGAAGQLFRLRQADALATTGRPEEALKIYRELAAQPDLLAHQPFSLIQLAALLYERGEFAQARQYYTDLSEELPPEAGRDLALYRSAACQLRSGRQSEASILLDNIIMNLADSEGAARARLKQTDLRVIDEAAREKKKAAGEAAMSPAEAEAAQRRALLEQYLGGIGASKEADPAEEYAAIAGSAPSQELREEAAFKQVLIRFLHHDPRQAALLLKEFLQANPKGRLFAEASALQVELLPAMIKERISAGDPDTALALAEKNRPLLASGKVESDFLAELGLAFTGLCLWGRAIKVYLYMLELARDKTEEQKLYRPLIEAQLASGDYAEVEKRAADYEQRFPQGPERGRIFFLRLEALKQDNQLAKAVKLLKTANAPEDREVQLFAGRLFFERGEYDEAEKFLNKAIGGDLAKASPEDVLLRAETLFRAGNARAAAPLYQHLKDDAARGDQAAYRLAQIELATADTNPDGIKLLRELVEKAKSPLWKRLAAETLAAGVY